MQLSALGNQHFRLSGLRKVLWEWEIGVIVN